MADSRSTSPAAASVPETFQSLTDEDQVTYGVPPSFALMPPVPRDERGRTKLDEWLAWRAAPYPADRHSEYLSKPEEDAGAGPRILVSAVLCPPPDMDTYIASIARNRRYDVRGRKAIKHGYTARGILPSEHAPQIRAVIHSTDARQGRPIAAMFLERPADHSFDAFAPTGDSSFDDVCTGVFAPDGALAAYLLGRRVGDHVQYEEIMGHADHIRHDVMYLLHFAFLEQVIALDHPPACLNYGSWYSGTNPFSPDGGLNRWKRKVKFTPAYLILASSSERSRDQAPRC